MEGPAPQAAVAGAPGCAAPATKTENCCARLRPWQLGHSGWREPMIRASKGFLQSLQMYSKMGIVTFGSSQIKGRILNFRYIEL